MGEYDDCCGVDEMNRIMEEYAARDSQIVETWNSFVRLRNRRGNPGWFLVVGEVEDMDQYAEMLDDGAHNALGLLPLYGVRAPIGFLVSVDSETLDIVTKTIPRESQRFPGHLVRSIEYHGTPTQMVQHLNRTFSLLVGHR